MFLSANYSRMDGLIGNSGADGYEGHSEAFASGLIVNGVRSRKKISDLPPRCPVCSCTVRSHELQTHFSVEMERLSKLSSPGGSKRKLSTSLGGNAPMAGSSASTSANAEHDDVDVTGCLGGDVYKKVHMNRLRRLKRSRRRSVGSRRDAASASRDPTEPRGACPICKVNYPVRRLQRHALRCLRDSGEGGTSSMSDVGDTSSEDGTIDVEGDGGSTTAAAEPPGGDGVAPNRLPMLSYEWCGEERIRATALLALEHTNLFRATTPQWEDDHDLPHSLVVDDDEDEELYGPAQFSPSLLCLRDECLPDDAWSTDAGAALMVAGARQEPYPVSSDAPAERADARDGDAAGADRHLVQALRLKLRELESTQTNHAKCHICLSPYTDPVVSIQCWHVHCGNCWVDTLRAKKTCPQCMAITSTHHLRRIYI